MFLFLKPIEGAESVFPKTSQLVSFRNFSFEILVCKTCSRKVVVIHSSKGITQKTPEVLNAYYQFNIVQQWNPWYTYNETLYNEVDPRYNELFSLLQ